MSESFEVPGSEASVGSRQYGLISSWAQFVRCGWLWDVLHQTCVQHTCSTTPELAHRKPLCSNTLIMGL